MSNKKVSRVVHNTMDEPPRVSSSYSWAVYEELKDITRYIDFRQPRFMGRKKRSHSSASVQALLVELALENEAVCNKLRGLMEHNGRDWKKISGYVDKYV
jgi:hypothetical protein